MLSSKMYWGYLTSATQMVQPPALSQIGLSLNNNSAFAFVGSLTDIVSYCCKHSRIKILLQRASSNSREVDDQTNTIEVQVKYIRTIYSVMNPLSSIMVVLRPHSVQSDQDSKRKNQRKRFTLPSTSNLLELAVGLNQMFDRSIKQITNFTPHHPNGQSPSSGLRARSGTTSLLIQSTSHRQVPDVDIDWDLPIYTAEPDGEAGGFSTLPSTDLLPPPYEAMSAA
ncbi:hypothetical protein K450DRAFT_241155 [Umbelopsis ramanniana AG]|uniref:Uncharacterized protein n=1 Tax=Umbelopsis ramanniana AG TaxID=1314678 RepID=A0AAD5HE64_UMBRA|nr:uncharacterized protein K450DRAFT_241155 [Umbelopsis ramanniana AG]KAI8579719.1 hypothetical protein K450DRAFT_241155 [Umbelopsis ramanniana AG]